MADNLKPEDRRRTMQAIKSKGTKLEKCLFAIMVRMGLYGWKKNVNTIAGKPDVTFFQEKVAIFADGCFWHGCPICRRKLPQTNEKYWEQKITRNKKNAKRVNRQLKNEGWVVIRLWEHEIKDLTKRKTIRMKIAAELAKRGRG